MNPCLFHAPQAGLDVDSPHIPPTSAGTSSIRAPDHTLHNYLFKHLSLKLDPVIPDCRSLCLYFLTLQRILSK